MDFLHVFLRFDSSNSAGILYIDRKQNNYSNNYIISKDGFFLKKKNEILFLKKHRLSNLLIFKICALVNIIFSFVLQKKIISFSSSFYLKDSFFKRFRGSKVTLVLHSNLNGFFNIKYFKKYLDFNLEIYNHDFSVLNYGIPSPHTRATFLEKLLFRHNNIYLNHVENIKFIFPSKTSYELACKNFDFNKYWSYKISFNYINKILLDRVSNNKTGLPYLRLMSRRFKIVLHVNSMRNEEKGFDEFMSIINYFSNANNSNYLFISVGHKIPLSFNLNLNKVILSNYMCHENILILLSFSKLLIVSSLWETFSNISAESIYLGTPVLYKKGLPVFDFCENCGFDYENIDDAVNKMQLISEYTFNPKNTFIYAYNS